MKKARSYDSHLWELSLLRLNQLDYFDPLKVDTDSETHQDQENGTVDLLLKVHEKGKNSIGLNGGVSGLSGSFPGPELPDEQLPGARRDAERAGQRRQPGAQSFLRL